MGRQFFKLILYFSPLAVGLGIFLGSLYLAFESPIQEDLQQGNLSLSHLFTQAEEWIGLPLRNMVNENPAWWQRFTEYEGLLEVELDDLSLVSSGLATDAKSIRLAMAGVREAAERLMASNVNQTKEDLAIYMTQAESLRKAIHVVRGKLEAEHSTRVIRAEFKRRDHMVMSALGVLMATLWAACWMFLAGRSRARSLGRVVRCAKLDEATQRGEDIPEVEPASLGEVMKAVSSLAERLAEQRRSTEYQIQQQDMLRDFTEALETTDEEGEILQLFQRMVTLRHPGRRLQVLLTDASEAELRPVFEEPDPLRACIPGSPARCKAIRMGRALRVNQSSSMTSCPRAGTDSQCYACIPLTIGGRSSSVVRVLGSDSEVTVTEILDVVTVAQRFAVRLGVQRLLATTSLQARTDALTGMPNRRVLHDGLERALATSQTGSGKALVAVLALDLDHFKQLNDTYGHAAGDAALRRFGNVVMSLMPEEGLIGRTGGEEFAAFAPVESIAAGMEFATRIIESVRDLLASASSPFTTVSIGVAFAPRDGDTVDEVLVVADERLYQAKEGGRDRAVGPLAIRSETIAA